MIYTFNIIISFVIFFLYFGVRPSRLTANSFFGVLSPRPSLWMVKQTKTMHQPLCFRRESSFGSNGLLKIANKSNGSMYRFNVSQKINAFFLFISRELNDSFAIDDNNCCPQRGNVSSTQYL